MLPNGKLHQIMEAIDTVLLNLACGIGNDLAEKILKECKTW